MIITDLSKKLWRAGGRKSPVDGSKLKDNPEERTLKGSVEEAANTCMPECLEMG